MHKDSERLNIMTKTSAGFKIAEEDIKLRGSGDLFGERQSGDMKFRLASINNDFNLLLKAKEEAESYNKTKKESNKILDTLLEGSKNLD